MKRSKQKKQRKLSSNKFSKYVYVGWSTGAVVHVTTLPDGSWGVVDDANGSSDARRLKK